MERFGAVRAPGGSRVELRDGRRAAQHSIQSKSGTGHVHRLEPRGAAPHATSPGQQAAPAASTSSQVQAVRPTRPAAARAERAFDRCRHTDKRANHTIVYYSIL